VLQQVEGHRGAHGSKSDEADPLHPILLDRSPVRPAQAGGDATSTATRPSHVLPFRSRLAGAPSSSIAFTRAASRG
jgi:hypothetical protein